MEKEQEDTSMDYEKIKEGVRLMLEGMQEEAAERASRRQNRKEREEEV